VAFGGASLLIPLDVVQLGRIAVDLGVLFATSAMIGAPGAIVFGRLADRLTYRRPLVLVTLVVVSVAMAVLPVLDSITAVIVANAGLWLVLAAIAPVLTMLVVDGAPSDVWPACIGQLNKFQGYGWAGGLVLGAIWPVVGRPLLGPDEATRALFWLLAVCAAAAGSIAARTLPGPAADVHVSSERTARRIARLVAGSGGGVKGATFVCAPNRLYWSTRSIRPRRLLKRLNSALATYFLAAGLFFTGSAMFWAPLPLFFTDVGFTAGQIFGLYLASSVASAVLYEPAGRGLLFVIVGALGALGAASLGVGSAGVLLALLGISWAAIAVLGTAIVTRLAPTSVRGESLGVYTAIIAVAGGVGGLLGGWVATIGYLAAFDTAGGLVGVGAILVAPIRVLSGPSPPVTAPQTASVPGSEALPPVSDREVDPEPER
jgi:MFS family permease